ncbi:molybdopterin-synthase adenylyltransferase MoeB [Fulvivirga maritima]|uniref:molybdopterin-synthase adenylyltransferase MoeB n=1 Tax=Fulvivirga maritima TaxID=2904247 RepID=UPI001F3C0A51|nr:molybdopterin-synthase adenylyltransferase MoeB [Fulvivirga maritima]UII25101.1 molybdopterin-synthase adenylyltransferase MoeB [Fulvivirga maritima]
MSLSKAEENQYSRQLILNGFGKEKQEALKAASVLVVGAGGLGCPALLYLAAAGVGTLGIIDGDVVEASNLHRQILYTHDDIGKNKAECAAKRLQANNPFIDVTVYKEALDKSNALEIITHYDLVIDGTDNFPTRYLINDACVILNRPFVYGAIAQFEGQVGVFNYKNGPTYRCLFPEPPLPGTVASCAEAGVIGVLPGLIGTYQAMEAIKMVTGIGQVRAGSLLVINTLENTQYTLKISLNAENKKIKQLSDYHWFCGEGEVSEITVEQLKKKQLKDHFTIVDVREPHEVEAFNIGGLFIPLSELPDHYERIPDQEIVVVCQSGVRSARAVTLLKESGFTTVYSLAGGLNVWKNS